MAEKCYKSYKFSVEQVLLMKQLIETGMTETEVTAGFKQIQDTRNKNPLQTSRFQANSRNVMEVSTPSLNRSQVFTTNSKSSNLIHAI